LCWRYCCYIAIWIGVKPLAGLVLGSEDFNVCNNCVLENHCYAKFSGFLLQNEGITRVHLWEICLENSILIDCIICNVYHNLRAKLKSIILWDWYLTLSICNLYALICWWVCYNLNLLWYWVHVCEVECEYNGSLY
jgi:hypothetical protein